jgi:hypothetical protein
MEYVSITTNSSKGLKNVFAPGDDRDTARPPDKAYAPSGGEHRNQNQNCDAFFKLLQIIFFKDNPS